MSKAKVFGAIYTSVAISYLGVGLVAPLIAIVLAERGADSFLVGLVGTTMFAAFTLASFPVGAATDRVGPKPLLIGGLVVYGVSILAFAVIRDVWLFFFARAVEGVGAAAISVATETMISQLSEPQERARRMSYYALSVGLGWAAGPMTGVLLFGIGQELPFYGGFAFSLAAALLAAMFIPASPSNSHKTEKVLSVISARLISPVAAGALYGYLMSSMVTLFPLYLKAINIEEKKMGSIVTAVIIGTLISQVPLGRAADRFGKQQTLMVCSVALAVVFALMPSRSEWGFFIATATLLGALAGSLYPIGLSMIGGLVSPDRLGAATSLFSLAFGVGSLTGPALSGFAMSHLGNRWLFYLPAGLTAVFCLLLASTNGRQKSSSA
ncbi:MAG TPA: MFS transporter [Blastocatellia bacterium]